MSTISKAALATGVSSTFFDNISGSITPTTVRSQQNDIIDSLLSQIVAGTGTAAGSLVFWTGSSTTAQLILGVQGSPLYVEGTAPAWMPSGNITFDATSATKISIANSTDVIVFQISGPTQTTRFGQGVSGGIINVVNSGSLTIATSNTNRFVIDAAGAFFDSALSSQGSGTGNFTGLFESGVRIAHAALAPLNLSSTGILNITGASGTLLQGVAGTGATFATSAILGVPGTTQGTLKLHSTGSTSSVRLVAPSAGASYDFVFPPSMGTAHQLLKTDGTVATWNNTGQLLADTSGVAASSGNMGDFVTVNVSAASGAALTTAVVANAASQAFGAGDWDIWGHLSLNVTASWSASALLGAVGTTSVTLNNLTASEPRSALGVTMVGTTVNPVMFVGMGRMLFSTTTTVFLIAEAFFSAGSATAGGLLAGRRRR